MADDGKVASKETVEDTAKLTKDIGELVATEGTDVGAWVDVAKRAPRTAKKGIKLQLGCCTGLIFLAAFAGLWIMFLFFPEQAPANNKSADCGLKATTETPPKLSVCNGAGGTTKELSKNGFYRRTTFGCSGKYTDSEDNCSPQCPSVSSVTKTSGTVSLKGKTGSSYEKAIEYFSANQDQYGCGSILKVTNTKTGKAVVVKVIERGPGCYGAHQDTDGLTFDMSNAASDIIGSPDVVKVEKVANTTPIGPVTCDISGGTTSDKTTATIPTDMLNNIKANKSVYQAAATKEGLPWQLLAALHCREASCDPGKSLLSGEKIGTTNPDNKSIVTSSLQDSADKAAAHLKSMAKSVYGVTLSASSAAADVQKAFLAYNRGSMYKNGGCTVGQSPYVFNNFDVAHFHMHWPNSSCEPVSTQGKINIPNGAYTIYVYLINKGI